MLNVILKIILVALLLYIVYNLFKGLFSLLRTDDERPPMSYFLGRRVLFSALVMILIILALAFGVVTPNPRPY